MALEDEPMMCVLADPSDYCPETVDGGKVRGCRRDGCDAYRAQTAIGTFVGSCLAEQNLDDAVSTPTNPQL